MATLEQIVTPAAGGSSAETRERLLDAAEQLFAARGYRAASVRSITREAGCNLAAVNYHFGGKANLYREVFRRRLALLRELRIASLKETLARAGADATLELLLGAFTSAFVEPLIREAEGRVWMQLMSREMLDPQLPRKMFVAEMVRPVQEALVAALQSVCPRLDEATAGLCADSLVGQLAHVVNLHRCLPDEERPTASLAAKVQHIVRFSAAGTRALATPEA